MKVDPIKEKKEVRKIIKWLTDNQKYRILVMFEIGIYTGLRISDILNLKVKDVKCKSYLKGQVKKTGKRHNIEIHPELRLLLKDYCKNRNINEYLIKSNKGENKPISRTQAYRDMKTIEKKCKIKSKIACHSTRKTYGYHLYKDNDISIVQGALQHNNQLDTLRYIGVEEEEINKATKGLSF